MIIFGVSRASKKLDRYAIALADTALSEHNSG